MQGLPERFNGLLRWWLGGGWCGYLGVGFGVMIFNNNMVVVQLGNPTRRHTEVAHGAANPVQGEEALPAQREGCMPVPVLP